MGAKVLEALPEVVMWVVGVVCGQLKGMHTGILLQGPGKPTLRMCLLNAVLMWGAADGQKKQFLGSWAES